MFNFISLGIPFVVRGYGRLTGVNATEIMKQKDSAQQHTLGYNDNFRMTSADMCSDLSSAGGTGRGRRGVVERGGGDANASLVGLNGAICVRRVTKYKHTE